MRRLNWVTDCGVCAGVCCIATSFDVGDDFAHTKRCGERCHHLTPNFRCAIHAQRERRGYQGCAVYDCHGAGPRVTAGLPGEHRVSQRSAAFLVVRQLHELLVLLEGARSLLRSRDPLLPHVDAQLREVDALADVALREPGQVDVDQLAITVHRLLRRVGEELGGSRESVRRRLRVLRRGNE